MILGMILRMTLVMTQKGSQADRFCQEKLPELDVHNNRFLCYSKSTNTVQTCDAASVEVLYTDSIDLQEWMDLHDCKLKMSIQTRGTGSSTPGGLLKEAKCANCNLDSNDESDNEESDYSNNSEIHALLKMLKRMYLKGKL